MLVLKKLQIELGGPLSHIVAYMDENFMYRRLAIRNRQVKFWRGDFSKKFGEFSSKNRIFTHLSAISVQSKPKKYEIVCMDSNPTQTQNKHVLILVNH